MFEFIFFFAISVFYFSYKNITCFSDKEAIKNFNEQSFKTHAHKKSKQKQEKIGEIL